MLWRWACWGAGAVLLVLAGMVLLLKVSVRGPGTLSRSCGSAWDVVAGRTGWPQWRAAGLTGPAGGPGGLLVRLPAILLIALGRGVSLMAGYLAHAEATREPP